jgi:hypothetical protein
MTQFFRLPSQSELRSSATLLAVVAAAAAAGPFLLRPLPGLRFSQLTNLATAAWSLVFSHVFATASWQMSVLVEAAVNVANVVNHNPLYSLEQQWS